MSKEQQKAKELIGKFKFYPGMDRSKKSALIHVEGIIEDYTTTLKDDGFALDIASEAVIESRIEFYQSVKEEITKLILFA